MPSRRSFLAGVGAATGLGGGCVGPSVDAPGTSRSTNATETTAADAPVAVESVSVHSSYVGVLGGHHPEAVFSPGKQYVLVRTDVPGGEYPRPNATVSLDGESYESVDALTHAEYRGAAPATPVVPVPREVSPDAGRVTVNGTRLALDGTLLDRLANPPRFDVTEVGLPERVTAGSEFDLRLTVVHRGGRDDAFRANARACVSGWRIVERALTAGETATATATLDACPGETDAQRVVAKWRGTRVERALPVDERGGNTS